MSCRDHDFFDFRAVAETNAGGAKGRGNAANQHSSTKGMIGDCGLFISHIVIRVHDDDESGQFVINGM